MKKEIIITPLNGEAVRKAKQHIGKTFDRFDFVCRPGFIDIDGIGRCKWNAPANEISNINSVRLVTKNNRFVLLISAESNDKKINNEKYSPPKPTKEQQAVIDSVCDLVAVGQHCCIDAPAGTGKTFMLRFLINAIEGKANRRVSVCSTTHKSIAVIEKNIGFKDVFTIHSLLGVKPVIDYETGKEKYTIDTSIPAKIRAGEVVICDESSMINAELLELIVECINELKCVFVFIGDSKQLPPVNEDIAMALNIPNKFTLSKIVRHDNSIVDASVYMRECIDSGVVPSVEVFEQYEDIEIIRDERKFNSLFFDMVEHQKSVLFVAWTNRRVDAHARATRKHLGYPEDNFVRGEVIVLNAPVVVGGNIKAQNNSVHVIKNVKDVVIEDVPMKAVTTYEGLKFNTAVDNTLIESKLSSLANAARKNPITGWKKYYRFKETCVPISFHHSCTVHKSQGSTVESVFVDYNNIAQADIASKLLYVAITRASKRVYILA